MQAELCKFLCERDNYFAYAKHVQPDILAPEVADFIKVLGDLFTSQPKLTTVDPGAAKPFFMLRCKMKPAELDRLLAAIDKADPDVYDVDTIVGDFIKMDYSNQIVDAIMKADGKPDPAVLKDLLDGMTTTLMGVDRGDKHLLDLSLDTLVHTFLRSGGYSWRLDFLNRAIGPVGAGDLIVVGARPESGKTTFITSEVTHMATQMEPDEGIIIFNNEEKGSKILGRALQSALGKSSGEIAADPAAALAAYTKLMGRQDKVQVYHRSPMSTYDVERAIKASRFVPKIIVFNVLDKVRGFKNAGNETERLRQLYVWAREMASTYDALVMVVAQADATAENVKYIYQDQLYNSKTAIQGEADVLITIGALHGVDDKRFFNIPKNKIPPTAGVDPSLSHGKEEVFFDAQRGRYGR